ncbi:unnamed protein product [Nippostrongylus brasiliensis]|uniref:CAP-Gly domain-containing protein n=1 Tax=Nippostrongylus brasiliensis TaxID=27835 RepID=A0A0N4YF90_NIPBR|nr:unnamed protein product [Nippostrongylus brasiliensis]
MVGSSDAISMGCRAPHRISKNMKKFFGIALCGTQKGLRKLGSATHQSAHLALEGWLEAQWASSWTLVQGSDEVTVLLMSFEIGARVETEKTGKGRVAFCGEVQLSDGEWLGVILDEPRGKNNGTVQGVQYFTCELNYGLFVRPAQLKLESAQVTPTTKARASPGDSPKVNPSVSMERLSKAAGPKLEMRSSKLADTTIPLITFVPKRVLHAPARAKACKSFSVNFGKI